MGLFDNKQRYLRWKEKYYEGRKSRVEESNRVLTRYAGKMGARLEFKLIALWRAWEQVFGEQLAELAKPLGHRGSTLVIGADDPVVMQELQFFQQEIIMRANAYLGQEFFDKVSFELLSGKAPLNEVRSQSSMPRADRPEAPDNLGSNAELLKGESAVARAYRAHVRRLAAKK